MSRLDVFYTQPDQILWVDKEVYGTSQEEGWMTVKTPEGRFLYHNVDSILKVSR